MRRTFIIDDSPFMRAAMKSAIEKGDYSVVEEAGSGKEALDKLKDLSIDLILLDNIMPDMLGLDVFKEIKKLTNTPVIMVSAVGQEAVVNKGLEMGLAGYLTKPFEPKELLENIEEIYQGVAKDQ
jgi:two-component system chemotaxis response regulator CheY